MTPEQLSKLPKWAQHEITLLQNNIKILAQKLDAFNGESETNTFIKDGLSEKPIPYGSCILFTMGVFDRNRILAYIDRDGSLSINGYSDMGQTMIIKPSASNVFYVDFAD